MTKGKERLWEKAEGVLFVKKKGTIRSQTEEEKEQWR